MPSGHGAHDDAPELESVSAGHLVQFPPVDEYVPVLQKAQKELENDDEVPDKHFEQLVAPNPDENVPGLHAEHAVVPLVPLKEP